MFLPFIENVQVGKKWAIDVVGTDVTSDKDRATPTHLEGSIKIIHHFTPPEV